MIQVAAAPTTAGQPAGLGSTKSYSFADGLGLRVTVDREQLSVDSLTSGERSSWRVRADGARLSLEARADNQQEPNRVHLLAALDASFSRYPSATEVSLTCPRGSLGELVQSGLVRTLGAGEFTVSREAFWQQPEVWRPAPAPPCPVQYTLSAGKRHPIRPPKPSGVVYRRHIPWLDKTLTFRTPEERDLPRFSQWMNDPVVAHFWQEQGDLEKHRAYLEGIARDPHIASLIGSFDSEPFGYFEVYFAKENRLSPFYDARDFDRGWHVLVGEARFRGAPYLTAWMPSLSHYLFLDDWRTERIVIEPRSDNAKMLKSLTRCGYAVLKEFEFPHKRAALGMLLRERFFADGLWIPQAAH
ncbi:MAG: GNAT family N-acetyltransferase [Polyangiaceae bacterium]